MSVLSFRHKIINLFYSVAKGSKKVRTLLTPLGGLVFLSFVGLFILLGIQTDKTLGFRPLLSPPANISVSLPVLSIGAMLIIWSIIHFVKNKGTPVPFNPPPKLITTGPYAYSRNPMLTGVFLVLFGLGFLLQSVSLIFIFTPFFVLINLLELKAIEEPELEKRLGTEYSEYKKVTPMFIPLLDAFC